MIFEHSEKARHWIDRVSAFIREEIEPAVPVYQAQDEAG